MIKNKTVSIQYLKGIGPKKAELFKKAGIFNTDDLLYYFPRRYEDRRRFSLIADLKEGQAYTIKADIVAKSGRLSLRRSGFSITEITAEDASGRLSCVWFNQPYLDKYFKAGQVVILYGKVEIYNGRLQMSCPEFEIISEGRTGSSLQQEKEDSLHIGRIVPIYRLPEGMSQRWLRQVIKRAIDECIPKTGDALPYDIRNRLNLLNFAKSLINIHFPENDALQGEALRRLSFEEFFIFQLPLVLRKLKKKERPGIRHCLQGNLVDSFIEILPFQLTPEQKEVILEIKKDMSGPFAMQRLLQGEVGSGKTVVATIASLIAIQGGYQVAFMVPTEILARQHHESIGSQLFALGSQEGRKIKAGLLVSSLSGKEKERVIKEINEGRVDLLIGTHALLEEGVKFRKLGLVVIDEQHKFGVGQRAILPKKGGNPDTLIMTATPIPRTLAITLYGDLDHSIIRHIPPGRKLIQTLHFTSDRRKEAWDISKNELSKGRQVYIVYPAIEESYALDIAGVKNMYAQLKAGEFREFRLGLVHGRMKDSQAQKTMSEFREGKFDILVTTTILEVGIDIPNATCIIIENAERFGLAQLHQLRGRVGRGKEESFCLLISDLQTEEAGARIRAMVECHDGFRIAEDDLKIRGPGDFFGERQHGLMELKLANPLTQMRLLKRAREEAMRLLENDPALAMPQNRLLKERLLQRFPAYEEIILVG
ncbi:MAG: ATP-dependent DNA helicase RecG [Candidatus Omnitrophota bacterium]